MKALLGIDLGTSSVKVVVIDIVGTTLSLGQEQYDFDIPREGWAEQTPETWWEATKLAIVSALSPLPKNSVDIVSIGLSGQMHGLVTLDRAGKSVRKSILWCDQRSGQQVKEINQLIGCDTLAKITHSPIATGFQIASLLWMKEKEPKKYEKIKYAILPKDYIRYRLTGEIGTDVTDAASTCLFDCNTFAWSAMIMSSLGFEETMFPSLGYPETIAGKISKQAAYDTGLREGTLVAFGGADQVMQAIGNGIIKPGIGSVTIGTGGQILMPLASSIYDAGFRSHTFCFYKKNSWYFLGATLAAGLSLKWLRNMVDPGTGFSGIDEHCEPITPGANGLLFLPYLAGERTPYMDSSARGVFFGLTLKHTKYDLYRAVMEGVAFSLKDCLNVLTKDLKQNCDILVASGGGAHSHLWSQLQANILNREIIRSKMKEQASYGAAIVAGVASGAYASIEEACESIIQWDNTPIVPQKETVKRYDDYYCLYQELYHNTKGLMLACEKLSQENIVKKEG